MGDWRSTSLEWPWPWPWFRPYGIPSCITHRPLPIYQISLKPKKLFVDGRTDIFPPILLGRLLEVDLKKRDANTARTGCSKVPTLPARCKHRQDRLQYTAAQLASAQCNNNSKRNVYFNSLLSFAFPPELWHVGSVAGATYKLKYLNLRLL